MYMMPQSSSPLFSLLLVLSLYYYSPVLVSCTESEVQALLSWRSSLKHPGNLTKMWSYDVSTDPCRWDGISCNHAGSITEVYYNGSSDSIDGTFAKFNFSSFPNLTSLQFTENHNLHGEIPEEIGRLHNLLTLDLSDNSLTGQIPTAIQNLSNIEDFDLSENGLSGQIPRTHLNLSNIEFLSLFNNELTGEIPREILKLPNLRLLDLSYNKFTSEIPNMDGHSNALLSLSLSGNMLSGYIPAEIENMTELALLDFSYNELQGEIPATIAQLPNLSVLYLQSNQLTGFITPYLGENNSMLLSINLSNNNFTGTVPSSICRGGTLEYFVAINNNFHDLLPNTLQNCTSIEVIDLANNNIKVDISHIFGVHPNLTYVDLSQNQFYGRLVSNSDGLTTFVVSSRKRFLSMSTKLQVFNMDNNNLNGEIPSELTNSTSLSVLVLSNNNFSSLSLLNASSLSSLHLSNNQLVGEFPLLQRNWTSLITLDLGENNFSDEIPSWIGSCFPILKILRIRSNQFVGSIPPQLSKLNNLQLLDLSNNKLTGPIPHIFSTMSFMDIKTTSNISYVNKNVPNYQERIDVIWKGEEFTFERTLDLLTGIDLSCNSLSSEIPEDLMKLQGLIFLNLSRNQLSGVISHNIGNLTWIEVLDLSMNHFSGIIPSSISHLTHLAILNLSHNKLTGQIPIGSQIQTFNSSAFSDNDGLCGLPLPNNCLTRNSSIVTPADNEQDHKLEVIWTICSIILGFIIGFWIYFGTLFWKASLRFGIYHFVDELGDKFMKW